MIFNVIKEVIKFFGLGAIGEDILQRIHNFLGLHLENVSFSNLFLHQIANWQLECANYWLRKAHKDLVQYLTSH